MHNKITISRKEERKARIITIKKKKKKTKEEKSLKWKRNTHRIDIPW